MNYLLEKITVNFKSPFIYVFILIVFTLLILFSSLYLNEFSYKQIDYRINSLKIISEINLAGINDNDVLMMEYEELLSEIEKNNSNNNSLFETGEDSLSVKQGKFISGAIVFFAFSFCMFLNYESMDVKTKIGNFVSCILFSCICGLFAMKLPTIIDPIVNYIAIPIYIILFMFLYSTIYRQNLLFRLKRIEKTVATLKKDRLENKNNQQEQNRIIKEIETEILEIKEGEAND